MTDIALADLHLPMLPAATQRAFAACAKFDFLDDAWYLAGGTALALQVGHRTSVDLDFFRTDADFDTAVLERDLAATHQWKTTLSERATLYGELAGAKMSFIGYPFFRPSPERVRYGAIAMLTPSDIATMKIIAISQRGRKRDFIDLYWYAKNREDLHDVIQRTLTQYAGQEHNLPHILKSLVYFVDAEEDLMPHLYFDASWQEVKAYFKHEVPLLTKKLLRLT